MENRKCLIGARSCIVIVELAWLRVGLEFGVSMPPEFDWFEVYFRLSSFMKATFSLLHCAGCGEKQSSLCASGYPVYLNV